MSAHTSHVVALARMEIIVEVRPEEEGPKISLIAPRGSPPVRMSSESIPVGTVSKTRRSMSVKGDGIRSPNADSNRARRITDCIELHRERFQLYRTFVRYVNVKHHVEASTTNCSPT